MTARAIPKTYRAQRRRSRDNKPALVWQDRDTDLLKAVWHNRWLTRELLLLIFPPGEPPAHLAHTGPVKQPGTNLDRRLAKLFHHGFLDRNRTEYGGPLIYALTLAGAGKLTDELNRRGTNEPTPADTSRLDERNRVARAATIDHALAIARVRLSLSAAMEGTSWTLDTFKREGEDLKADWKTKYGRRYVIPDGFVILADASAPKGKQRAAFFLEIDRSTMKASRMADKFARYSDLYTARMHQTYFGVPTFRVLTVCKSAERAENLRRLVRGEFTPPHFRNPLPAPVPKDHRAFFYFTDESQFTTPRNILAASWTRADDDDAERAGIITKPLPRTA